MSRFLVIQLARLGDMLQTARLLQTLRERGETHLCVDQSLVRLAQNVFPDVEIHGVPAHGAGHTAAGVLDSVRGALSALSTSFDGVYNLNHSGMNRALSTLFDPSVLHGHALVDGQAVTSRWLGVAFRWTGSRRCAPLNLVDVWAGLAKHPVAPDRVNPVAVSGGGGLGVVLAGRVARRSLPPGTLAGCIRAVFDRLGGPPIHFFGSTAERPLARKLMAALPTGVAERVIDLSGKTAFEDLPEALAGLDCLLTPDTGLMHLAARLGVPVQALFLSSAWAWETGPYGLGHTVWQAAVSCAPCLEAGSCQRDRACLAPFSRPLPAVLAGKKDLQPESGLWRLESRLDALGLAWSLEAGDPDEHMADRLARRQLMHEYLSGARPGKQACPGATPARLARHFYQEADWMLPDPLP